jgi:uncharacterized protein YeaO (DUF488 family)
VGLVQVLTQHLDYTVMAKNAAQSATRALGLLIAKSKAHGGLPFDCFSRLYDSLVWPILEYGAAIWGTRSHSCVKAVQNRACRFFLGVGRYTPTHAVMGDMGWTSTEHRQWVAVSRVWCRLVNMSGDRVNKAVFVWARGVAPSRNRKNWCARVLGKFSELHIRDLCDVHDGISAAAVRRAVDTRLSECTHAEWSAAVNREEAIRGPGRNKLRLYRTFKTEFGTENYVRDVLAGRQRSALAKFRCGVAPIALETGRYTNTPLEQRTCFICGAGTVETEAHVLLHCPLYIDIHNEVRECAQRVDETFNDMTEAEKLAFILANNDMTSCSAKACRDILHRRNVFLYDL